MSKNLSALKEPILGQNLKHLHHDQYSLHWNYFNETRLEAASKYGPKLLQNKQTNKPNQKKGKQKNTRFPQTHFLQFLAQLLTLIPRQTERTPACNLSPNKNKIKKISQLFLLQVHSDRNHTNF